MIQHKKCYGIKACCFSRGCLFYIACSIHFLAICSPLKGCQNLFPYTHQPKDSLRRIEGLFSKIDQLAVKLVFFGGDVVLRDWWRLFVILFCTDICRCRWMNGLYITRNDTTVMPTTATASECYYFYCCCSYYFKNY